MVQPSSELLPLYVERIREYVNGGLVGASLEDHFATAREHRGSFNQALAQFSDEERQQCEQILASSSTLPPAENRSTGSSDIDLAAYSSVAALPSMPWFPKARHPPTTREPNSNRKLESVHLIESDDFFQDVLSYVKARPPSSVVKSPWPKALRVPHPMYPAVATAGVRLPRSEKKVESWVDQVALQTGLCLLHSAESELADLDCFEAVGKGSQKALSDFVFERGSDTIPRSTTLLIEVKCPWTLPYSDMDNLAKLGTGLRKPEQTAGPSQPSKPRDSRGRANTQHSPPKGESKSKTNGNSYSPAESALAQVYDYCKEQEHCFWIITTYEYWVFGVFSKDYKTAMVTEPLAYDRVKPTILECIIYWLQSAHFRPGSFEIPKATKLPSTRPIWKQTLRLWRSHGVKELTKLIGDTYPANDAKQLVESCERSVSGRNDAVGRDLQAACHNVLKALPTPKRDSPAEWLVLLTWLTLLLDPITVNPAQETLERAFTEASSGEIGHPILKDFDHKRRAQRFDGIRARNGSTSILSLLVETYPSKSLHDFISNHASNEAQFTLHQYLPRRIRVELQAMLVKAELLPAYPEPDIELPKNFDDDDEEYLLAIPRPAGGAIAMSNTIISPATAKVPSSTSATSPSVVAFTSPSSLGFSPLLSPSSTAETSSSGSLSATRHRNARQGLKKELSPLKQQPVLDLDPNSWSPFGIATPASPYIEQGSSSGVSSNGGMRGFSSRMDEMSLTDRPPGRSASDLSSGYFELRGQEQSPGEPVARDYDDDVEMADGEHNDEHSRKRMAMNTWL
ncbi:hypothetical protein FRC04_002886 [Tulasnella sp. 424]|nr:hypothetical protein FRC04_002886 [Tulasnella sp. 424]